MLSNNESSLLDDETPPDPRAQGPFAALRRVLPSGEVIRFLLVGGSNTLVALGLYSGFVILFGHLLPHRGKPLIADIASITSEAAGDFGCVSLLQTFCFPYQGKLSQRMAEVFCGVWREYASGVDYSAIGHKALSADRVEPILTLRSWPGL